MSLEEFLHMGGHAFYVWLSYGMGLIVVLLLVVEPQWRLTQVVNKLKAFYRREQLDQAEKS